jgi:hypothetical protein
MIFGEGIIVLYRLYFNGFNGRDLANSHITPYN